MKNERNRFLVGLVMVCALLASTPAFAGFPRSCGGGSRGGSPGSHGGGGFHHGGGFAPRGGG
ncbi:MAG: sulfur globule protein precursor, partial [Kiritimatiellae bacterium]|nr:sulfur globule protein precursor [Kiritimatiellia bacterium]